MARFRGALRGFLFRCPRCGKGRMLRTFFEFHDTCSSCGVTFSPGEGEFTFAMMVSLFLVILAALPAYIAFDTWTDRGPNALAAATLVFVTVVYAWLYRHVKGAWYGWMIG